ncbi:bifunctional DedA family/phosphatase PAP2 family protein [Neptuniibacter halophilus]|uniref:bifunctional DedA family/phosphatase PAP2 family protein n=1 Tax=Neptuniibacter halophilus TaxID=651666 RepID=UPI0025737F5D|nr:bifunctional DedA family/phosphatase PAP2 family protein [Neptuniibacter halophilus]
MDYLSQLIQPGADQLLLLIAACALLESLAFVGLLLPGVALLFLLASMAAEQGLGLTAVLSAAFAGALLGDGLSFLLGRYAADRIAQLPLLQKHPEWLSRSEAFFRRYGIASLFIGRFIGPLRPLIPFIAGTLGLRPGRYLAINIASALLWAPFYLLPGYLAGLALSSLQLNPGLLLELLLILALSIWLYTLLHQQLSQMSLRYPLNALLLLFCSSSLFSLLCYLQISGQWQVQNEALFRQLYATPQAIQPLLYNLAASLTRLGDTIYILGASLALSFWLWRQGQRLAGFSFISLIVGGKLFNSLLKWLIAAPRPEPGMTLSSYSFPSGHSSAASTFFCALAVILACGGTAGVRRTLYLCALIPAVLVALSRPVLGVHWPLDVASGLIEGIFLASLLRLWLFFRDHDFCIQVQQKSQLLTALAVYTLIYVAISVWLF